MAKRKDTPQKAAMRDLYEEKRGPIHSQLESIKYNVYLNYKAFWAVRRHSS